MKSTTVLIATIMNLANANGVKGEDKMIDKRIEFDERFDDVEEGTTTLYFTAPKELLKTTMIKDYPEAVAMEISIELPTNNMEARYADVEVSPTRYIKEDDSYEEYDWYGIRLPYEEVEALINLARKSDRFDIIY